MNCPKIWFNLNYAYEALVPVKMQNASLDKIFMNNEEIITANAKNYNDYTKNFIKTIIAKDHSLHLMRFFLSDSYEYNPETHLFNFYEIKESSYDELIKNGICLFEPEKEYGKDIKNTARENLVDTIRFKYKKPTLNEGFYIDDNNWNFLVRNVIRKTNTILIGPTGTGKTELVFKIAEKLNLECFVYDMGSMIDPLTDLLGSHRLKDGSSIFDYAKFTQDIQKPGIILLDELSRAPLTTNNILFPCLDSRRALPIEIADSSGARSIKVHDDCVFIATANIGSEYSGTNEIDAALMNRFVPLKLTYLDKTTEEKLLMKRTKINQEEAEKIVNIINDIRSAYYKNEISKSASTRESILCGQLVYDGFSIIDAITNVVCNKFSDDSFNNEFNTVKKLIMKY